MGPGCCTLADNAIPNPLPRPRVWVETQSEWEHICAGLAASGLVTFLRKENVYHVRGQPVLNGMFVVPRDTPGVEIQPEPRNHNHIIYNDVHVPLDHLLGPEDGAKVLAQRRLGGGRIHHAMRTIAQCKLAFDMMCERALSRESHGKIIAEHQMVQERIADSYASIQMLRLFVLRTAWLMTSARACRLAFVMGVSSPHGACGCSVPSA